MTGAGSACRAVSCLRAIRSRFFFQSSGRSLYPDLSLWPVPRVK